jgi:hypothetical protein
MTAMAADDRYERGRARLLSIGPTASDASRAGITSQEPAG